MADATIRIIDIADQSTVDQLYKDIGSSKHAIAVALVGTAGGVLGQAEDAAHVSGDQGIMLLGVRKDSLSTPVSADGDYQAIQFDAQGRAYVNVIGQDSTNGILKSQPKTSVGSGGRLTADGTLHSGACTLMGVLVHATTGGTVDLSDATGAAGTSFGTIYCPANTTVYVPFPGVSMAVGVFGDITTLVGSMVAFVGPAVV